MPTAGLGDRGHTYFPELPQYAPRVERHCSTHGAISPRCASEASIRTNEPNNVHTPCCDGPLSPCPSRCGDLFYFRSAIRPDKGDQNANMRRQSRQSPAPRRTAGLLAGGAWPRAWRRGGPGLTRPCPSTPATKPPVGPRPAPGQGGAEPAQPPDTAKGTRKRPSSFTAKPPSPCRAKARQAGTAADSSRAEAPHTAKYTDPSFFGRPRRST